LPGPAALPDFMNRADIGMIQCRSSLSFSLEASQRLGVFGYFFGQKLQPDKSVEGYVLSFVDHAHAATADLLDDAVVAQLKADEGTLAECPVAHRGKLRSPHLTQAF